MCVVMTVPLPDAYPGLTPLPPPPLRVTVTTRQGISADGRRQLPPGVQLEALSYAQEVYRKVVPSCVCLFVELHFNLSSVSQEPLKLRTVEQEVFFTSVENSFS